MKNSGVENVREPLLSMLPRDALENLKTFFFQIDSTVYKGRKKKSIEYYAIKSVEKDQKARVLQEVQSEQTMPV